MSALYNSNTRTRQARLSLQLVALLQYLERQDGLLSNSSAANVETFKDIKCRIISNICRELQNITGTKKSTKSKKEKTFVNSTDNIQDEYSRDLDIEPLPFPLLLLKVHQQIGYLLNGKTRKALIDWTAKVLKQTSHSVENHTQSNEYETTVLWQAICEVVKCGKTHIESKEEGETLMNGVEDTYPKYCPDTIDDSDLYDICPLHMILSFEKKLWYNEASHAQDIMNDAMPNDLLENIDSLRTIVQSSEESGHSSDVLKLSIDSDFIEFSCRAMGRFDAYLLAIFSCLLLHPFTSEKVVHMPFQVPEYMAKSSIFAKHRAKHAIRVFKACHETNLMRVEKYKWYTTMLSSAPTCSIRDAIGDLTCDVWHYAFIPHQSDTVYSESHLKDDEHNLIVSSNKRLEQILIALVGNKDPFVRYEGIKLLNAYYDRHGWQLRVPFDPCVKNVGDRFIVEIVVEKMCKNSKEPPSNVFLILSAPAFDPKSKNTTYTYHNFEWVPFNQVEIDDYQQISWIGRIDFGVFTRCGFYDWRICRSEEDEGTWAVMEGTLSKLTAAAGLSSAEPSEHLPELMNRAEKLRSSHYRKHKRLVMNECIPLQGRAIVQPKNTEFLQFHEVNIDQQYMEWHEETGRVTKRGYFNSVKQSCKHIQKSGANSIVLLGATERATGDMVYSITGDLTFENVDASAYATTYRAAPSTLLGGVGGCVELIGECKKLGMKLLVDFNSRVSASHPHRNYSDLMLMQQDSRGRAEIYYGGETRGITPGETLLPNYRCVEAWDRFVMDIKTWIKHFGIDGIRIQDSSILPEILVPNQAALLRKDPDGQYSHSAEDIVLGKVIIPGSNSEAGYWSLAASAAFHPNPFFIKLCKALWQETSEFLVIGECWNMSRVCKFCGERCGSPDEDRCMIYSYGQSCSDSAAEYVPALLLRSGVIPQIHLAPTYFPALLEGTNANSGSFMTLLGRMYSHLPEGGRAIHATCTPTSPLPLLAFQHAAWPYLHFLSLLPDMFMTVSGDIEGAIYRLGLPNFFDDSKDSFANSVKSGLSSKLPYSSLNILERVLTTNGFESIQALPELESNFLRIFQSQRPDWNIEMYRLLFERHKLLRRDESTLRRGVFIPLEFTQTGGYQLVPEEPKIEFIKEPIYHSRSDDMLPLLRQDSLKSTHSCRVKIPTVMDVTMDREHRRYADIPHFATPTALPSLYESTIDHYDDSVEICDHLEIINDSTSNSCVLAFARFDRVKFNEFQDQMKSLSLHDAIELCRHILMIFVINLSPCTLVDKALDLRNLSREFKHLQVAESNFALESCDVSTCHCHLFAQNFAKRNADTIYPNLISLSELLDGILLLPPIAPYGTYCRAYTMLPMSDIMPQFLDTADMIPEGLNSKLFHPIDEQSTATHELVENNGSAKASNASLYSSLLFSSLLRLETMFRRLRHSSSTDTLVLNNSYSKTPTTKFALTCDLHFEDKDQLVNVLWSSEKDNKMDMDAVMESLILFEQPYLSLILLTRAACPIRVINSSNTQLKDHFETMFLDNIANLLELLNSCLQIRSTVIEKQKHLLPYYFKQVQSISNSPCQDDIYSDDVPYNPIHHIIDNIELFGCYNHNSADISDLYRGYLDYYKGSNLLQTNEGKRLLKSLDNKAYENDDDSAVFLSKSAISLSDILSESRIFNYLDESLICTLIARLQRIKDGRCTEDTEYCKGLDLANEVIETNRLGPIVFITPEIGRWSTVGGLGVMVDELSTTLATEFGQECIVISPYYDRNRKGEQGYLERDNIHHAFNIRVQVGAEYYTLGVHKGSVVKGVDLYFLHCATVFPHVYPDCYGMDAVRSLVTFAKAALEVLCHERLIPELIVTNDWPTSLVPAYGKLGFFGTAFEKTTFYHMVHNLDLNYEGRIYLNKKEDTYWLHQLPIDLLVDPLWQNHVINPSRCALLQCDNWGTVSTSYRSELMYGSGSDSIGKATSPPSPLAPLLRRHKHPFAFPNGIPIKGRLEKVQRLGFSSHWDAKTALQKKYFGCVPPDEKIPVFAFIGRITQQKGVHLIVDLAENLINKYDERIQIIVGGMANAKDGYASRCAVRMKELTQRYPNCFWAEPNEFFTNGTHVNLGADFGLMPSAFEPGGIVQHEFFICGTPVIAFHTGGLKDTVHECSVESEEGNGFTFQQYTHVDFMHAIDRAIKLFRSRSEYDKLRKRATESVVSCENCSWAWLCEFARIRQKMPINLRKVSEIVKTLPEWSQKDWIIRKQQLGGYDDILNKWQIKPRLPYKLFTKQGGKHSNNLVLSTAFWSIPPLVGKRMPQYSRLSSNRSLALDISPKSTSLHKLNGDMKMQPNRQLKPFCIRYVPSGKRPRSVAVAGSFDDWILRHPMVWDSAKQAFTVSLAIPPGSYLYKLVVEGEWICNPTAETEFDEAGNENNVLIVK